MFLPTVGKQVSNGAGRWAWDQKQSDRNYIQCFFIPVACERILRKSGKTGCVGCDEKDNSSTRPCALRKEVCGRESAEAPQTGHFRVAFNLITKARLITKLFMWKFVFVCMWKKNNCHKNHAWTLKPRFHNEVRSSHFGGIDYWRRQNTNN